MKSSQYITYEQLMNILNQVIDEQTERIANKVNKNNKLIKISNLKLGDMISSRLAVFTLITVYFLVGTPVYNILQSTNLYDGHRFWMGVGAAGIAFRSLFNVIGNIIPNFVDDESKKIRFKLKRENKNHNNDLETLKFQSSNLSLGDIVYQVVFNQNQKRIKFNPNYIDKYLHLLERFSIVTIGFHITNNTLDRLYNIYDKETIEEINSTALYHLNSLARTLDSTKESNKQEITNYIQINFRNYQIPNYDHNIISKNSKKGISYKDLIFNIKNKLEKERKKIDKQIIRYQKEYQQYYDDLKTCDDIAKKNQLINHINNYSQYLNYASAEKQIINRKLNNIRNWISTYNDFMTEKEKSLNLSSSLQETVYELLEYYDISMITMGMFGGFLDILENQPPYLIQNSNQIIGNKFNSYQAFKEIIQNVETTQYHEQFYSIIQKGHTL